MVLPSKRLRLHRNWEDKVKYVINSSVDEGDSEVPILNCLHRNKPALSSLSQDWVTIVVGSGEGKKEFKVHEGVICSYSSVFKAMFGSNMLEGETKRAEPEDVDPTVFERLHYWIYYQTLPLEAEREPVTGNQHVLLSNLFNLADRFLMTGLMNEAISKLYDLLIDLDLISFGHFVELVHHAYETEVDTKVKWLVIHKCAFTSHPETLSKLFDSIKLPVQAIKDIAVALKWVTKEPAAFAYSMKHGLHLKEIYLTPDPAREVNNEY